MSCWLFLLSGLKNCWHGIEVNTKTKKIRIWLTRTQAYPTQWIQYSNTSTALKILNTKHPWNSYCTLLKNCHQESRKPDGYRFYDSSDLRYGFDYFKIDWLTILVTSNLTKLTLTPTNSGKILKIVLVLVNEIDSLYIFFSQTPRLQPKLRYFSETGRCSSHNKMDSGMKFGWFPKGEWFFPWVGHNWNANQIPVFHSG